MDDCSTALPSAETTARFSVSLFTRRAMATMFRKPPPLLVPGSGAKPLRLAGQAAFASGAEPPPYVLHCVPVSGQGYLFAGSDDSLRLFSPTLEPGPRLKSTQKGITSLSVGAGEGSTAVFSTAKDGTVVGWDTRDMSKEAFKLKGQSLGLKVRRRELISSGLFGETTTKAKVERRILPRRRVATCHVSL